MATYRYKARDKAGVATVATLEADSRDAVARRLRQQGLQIITLEEAQGAALDMERMLQRVRRAPRPQEVVLFTRQLALMVRSGLPLIDGIEGIAGQAFSPVFKETLARLGEDLRGGKSFSEALTAHPAFFPTFYVSMVKSGEAAGILDEVMERLASIGEEEMELIGRVRAALAYPVLLVFLSLGIVAFLLIFILPKFTGIFEESGVALPLPTRILLFVSFLLRRFWFLLPVGVGAGMVLLGRYRRTPGGQARIHAALLRTPFLGALILKTILSRAFRIMASLLKSGIAVVPALAVIEELMGNRVLSEAMARVRRQVIGGKSLAEPFRAEKVFPSTIAQLVAVGERTGALDKTFLHLADYYEGEVDRALSALTSVLEPLLLLTMGLLVGFIALSVLLPIFQLIKVFQR